MNTVNIVGNLVRDWNTNVGSTTVSKNTIAVKRKFKKDESDFINIVAFGKSAELLGQYTNKGSKIGIVGRIQTGSYEKDGVKIYTTDIVVDEFEFLDSKKTEGGGNSTPSIKNNISSDIDSEDFPFLAYNAILG